MRMIQCCIRSDLCLMKVTLGEYLEKLWNGVYWILGLVATLAFPVDTFKKAAIAIMIGIILDVLTKMLYFRNKHGGILKAIGSGELSSKIFWSQTFVKFIGYAFVFIFVGLGYTNFPMFSSIIEKAASLVYFVMFFREFISVLENLRDAGISSLGWVIKLGKEKQDHIEQTIVKYGDDKIK